MATSAQIEIAGKKHTLLEFDFLTQRNTDESGRPSTVTRVRPVRAVLAINQIEHESLYKAMADAKKLDSVKITTAKTEEGAKGGVALTIELKNVYVVGYNDHFNTADANPQTLTLNLTAEKVTSFSSTIDQAWPSTGGGK